MNSETEQNFEGAKSAEDVAAGIEKTAATADVTAGDQPPPAPNPDTVAGTRGDLPDPTTSASGAVVADAPAVAPPPTDPRADAHRLMVELRQIDVALETVEANKERVRDQLAAALKGFGPELEDQKLTTPFGTAQIQAGARRVKIVGVIASDFMKTVPDEKKIGDAIRAGNVVSGAELGNGGETILRVVWPKN